MARRRDEERNDERLIQRHVRSGTGHLSVDESNRPDLDDGDTAKRVANPAGREARLADRDEHGDK